MWDGELDVARVGCRASGRLTAGMSLRDGMAYEASMRAFWVSSTAETPRLCSLPVALAMCTVMTIKAGSCFGLDGLVCFE